MLGLFLPHIRGFWGRFFHNIVIFERLLAKTEKKRENVEISGEIGVFEAARYVKDSPSRLRQGLNMSRLSVKTQNLKNVEILGGKSSFLLVPLLKPGLTGQGECLTCLGGALIQFNFGVLQ